MLELNRIYCGDNCDLLGKLPRECIDLVVTSPPYDDLRTYGGHSWDFYGVAWQLKRVLKPGGVIVWVVADATKDGSETGTSMEQALHFKRLGLSLHDTMIYQKLNYLPQNAATRYDQCFEFMFVLSAGTPKTGNMLKDRPNAKAGKTLLSGGTVKADGVVRNLRQITPSAFGMRSNIWPVAVGGEANDHPAPMPETLARDVVATWSSPGDVVLDPFSGSGTTAKAAKELGRRFLGLEINPEYCAIAERRIAQETLQLEAV